MKHLINYKYVNYMSINGYKLYGTFYFFHNTIANNFWLIKVKVFYTQKSNDFSCDVDKLYNSLDITNLN